ncbi:hypothetical protein ACFVVX_26765 [Kitasatospora sp. NPDC058170]
MPEFDRFTLAVVDDIRDRDQASDGHSRYGADHANSALAPLVDDLLGGAR